MQELRCTCSHKQLLAVVGTYNNGVPYLHVKAWKGSKLITEVILSGGLARILCRDCLRWYKIVFRTAKATLEITSIPVEIAK